MDWDDLRFFLALARARTVKSAARDLSVDSSTVTRRIAGLEEANGRLFERIGATYVVSERGREMLATAERVDSEMKALACRLHSAKASRVRVSFPTMLSVPVTNVVRGFAEERPDITLVLEVSDARVDLKGNQADVVVRIEEQPTAEFVGRRVGELRVAVFAAKSYLEHHSYPVDDPRHSWIAWDQAYANKAPMRFQRERFPDRRIVTQGATGEAVFQAIRAGLGLGLLPVIVGAEAGFTALYQLPRDASPSVWVLSAGELHESEAVRAVRARLFRLSESLRFSSDEPC